MENYHVHLGNASSGGECYVGKVTTVAVTHSITNRYEDANNPGYYHIFYSCGTESYSTKNTCGCTTTKTIYTLNCGKTEETIDSITITY